MLFRLISMWSLLFRKYCYNNSFIWTFPVGRNTHQYFTILFISVTLNTQISDVRSVNFAGFFNGSVSSLVPSSATDGPFELFHTLKLKNGCRTICSKSSTHSNMGCPYVSGRRLVATVPITPTAVKIMYITKGDSIPWKKHEGNAFFVKTSLLDLGVKKYQHC